ncbi:sigma-70 family RNA polymerase sigma factor [Acidovorax sp. DW039]|uniref:sigma-70 family RNA polymerase sigma factor n=1 Tax=Acidovorax sp. DW039 TaxID=3095606 RepID=UPI0030CD6CE3
MLRLDIHQHLKVEGLYGTHHAWLHRWLGSKLGCEQRAADLAHDTFVRLLVARIPSDLREPRAYLTTIARNLLADHWRRQELERAYAEAVAALPEDTSPSPEWRMELLQTLHLIDACLHRLPSQTRHIFLLSQVEGLVYAEIAAQLGISVPTVKRHMARAFEALMLHA